MRIGDVMSRDVCVISPSTSMQDAARRMAERDIGCLPVGENDRLVGMVTDRDMVLRGISEGRSADSPVGEVMTPEVKYCFEDEDVDEVAANMAGLEKRRLPVLDRDMRLVGIVSLANFAHSRDDEASQELLRGVARPH
ncbi:CBS domain-containing protein [Pseudoxanthomonas suwonensis]|jgi:FOG: CBS domain|uniref:CBS domain-containing protein n=1 Tax=Pseudoxanthomonas suwonensis TaxID=314722 RepID=UPI00138F99F6|nr:CBS domain-containing protein [Pseudoxanthomonas suwonensis]KAF1701458.1 inosine-5-monophosphate dehydrogenase [Pseudoxanthomonas suwonensis]